MNLNAIEEEVILLNAVIDIIDLMVTPEMLRLDGTNQSSTVGFKTSIHRRFFTIILVDFLSRTDKDLPTNANPYLRALREISDNPQLETDNSINLLRITVNDFSKWLNCKVSIKNMWLPSIDKQVSFKISRIDFLKMCGNISKHNILRSGRIVKDLQNTLANHGHFVDLQDAMLALNDFYERFHDDIIIYHTSTLIEFLNNIRWGIHEYLQPEFLRSRTLNTKSTIPSSFEHKIPTQIQNKYARQCYLDLMSRVQLKPFIKKFRATKTLKELY